MAETRQNVIVLGVGNPDRGDDAAGRAVAWRLRGRLPAGVVLAEHDGEATALLFQLQQAKTAVLVDACSSGAEPGTIYRFDAAAEALPYSIFGLSTHGFGVGEAVELARALGELPPRCVVYAIEGEAFDHGAALSPAVDQAVAALTERLCAQIEQLMETEVKSDA